MPIPKAVAALEKAIADEKGDLVTSELAYARLLSKIVEYQKGKGPAPSSEEFEAWRYAVEYRVAVAKLETKPDQPKSR